MVGTSLETSFNTDNSVYGWASRPVKDTGNRIVGLYLWSDTDFTSLSAAVADGNADGDSAGGKNKSDTSDNFGYIIVIDQNYFDGIAFDSSGDGETYKEIGTSSDKVDDALNEAMIIPSSLLTPSPLTKTPLTPSSLSQAPQDNSPHSHSTPLGLPPPVMASTTDPLPRDPI